MSEAASTGSSPSTAPSAHETLLDVGVRDQSLDEELQDGQGPGLQVVTEEELLNQNLHRGGEAGVDPAGAPDGRTAGGEAPAVGGTADGPSADGPSAESVGLDVAPASAVEDRAIPLEIQVNAGADTAITVLQVSEIPDGAQLRLGTEPVSVVDGVATLTRGDLAAYLDNEAPLSLTPPANSGEDFALTVSVTTDAPEGEEPTIIVGELPVSVDAEADVPTLTLQDIRGLEDHAIDLGAAISASLTDTDGSETLQLRIEGLPEGAVVRAGGLELEVTDGAVVVDADAMSDLSLELPDHVSGHFDLQVTAIATEGENGDTASASGVIGIDVAPVADGAVVSAPASIAMTAAAPEVLGTGQNDVIRGTNIGEAISGGDGNDVLYGEGTRGGEVAGNATAALTIDVALVDNDGSESATIVIAGVPEDAALSAGTLNADGTWSLTMDDLPGLTLTAPAQSADFDLTVTTTVTDRGPAGGGQDEAVSTTTVHVDFAGVAGNFADRIDGGSGNDRLYGQAGNDTLLGGAGNDTLVGGDGADSLSGGAGNDRIYFDAGDTIQGGEGTDTAQVYQSADGVTLDMGATSIERAYGGAGNDSFDASTVQENVTVYGRDGADTITGGAANDRLYGEAGNDVISGGAGNDTLVGGDGADSLSGGAGNDRIYFDAGDTIQGGEGTDTAQVYQSADGVTLDMGATSIERAYGGAGNDRFDASTVQENVTVYGRDGADTITGGAANDRLYGEAGNDVISGGAGNDTLVGGDGADSLSGGAGNDRIYFDAGDTIQGGEGTDTAQVYQSADGVTLDMGASSIERAYGGAGNDSFDASTSQESVTVYGRDGADTITGGDGSDHLYGEAGNDVIAGGAGNDTLIGGDGSDSLSGGAGNDRIYFDAGDTIQGGEGTDTAEVYRSADGVALDMGATSIERAYGGAGNDTFDASTNQENVTVYGRDGADTITGGDGGDHLYGEAGNDVISGGAGNDTLVGGDGADSLSGGAGNDRIYFDAGDTIQGGEGTDTAEVYRSADGVALDMGATSIERAYGGAGNDSFDASTNQENVTVYGRDGADTITGGDGSDHLYGEAGNDVIAGGAGNDTLVGGDGADVLSGGAGNDRIYFDAGDTIQGGEGTDTAQVYQTADGVALDMGATSIERAYGGAGNDSFDASTNQENVTVYGRDGADTITGGDGSDHLYGEAGNDVIAGGAGNDTLIGGDGADVLSGGAGNDRIYFDAGDTIQGGEGTDTAEVYRSGDGVALDMGAASIERAYGGAGNDSFDASTTQESVTVYGRDGADTITGGDGGDRLYGEAGDDVISGGAGNDTLVGGDGADVLSGGAGNDRAYGGEGSDLFTFSGGRDTFHGGDGGGWTDTVRVVAEDGSAMGSPDDGGWTIQLDQGEVVSQTDHSMALSDDASGTITTADGQTLAFDGVESVEW